MNARTAWLAFPLTVKNNSYFIKWFDELKDELIIFLDKREKISIFSSICPHFGGPIGYHEIKIKDDKPVFTCLWHNLQYFVETGQCVTQKKFCLRKYEIEIVKEEIFVYIN